MRKFIGMPDHEIVALLRDCNPRNSSLPDKPAYLKAKELGLLELLDSQAGLDYFKRTQDGTDYLLWARSFESVG
jgi:hypothetical protein